MTITVTVETAAASWSQQVQLLMHEVASILTCILMLTTLPGSLSTATHQGSEQGVLVYRFGAYSTTLTTTLIT
jgi:hypothetical protein